MTKVSNLGGYFTSVILCIAFPGLQKNPLDLLLNVAENNTSSILETSSALKFI